VLPGEDSGVTTASEGRRPSKRQVAEMRAIAVAHRTPLERRSRCVLPPPSRRHISDQAMRGAISRLVLT
jgi:hypothetical protein